MQGRFNLYDTPDGGLHISYQEDPTEVDENGTSVPKDVQHIDVPGQLLAMAKMLENGSMNPMQAFSKMSKMLRGK
jgi:hypothetical protein